MFFNPLVLCAVDVDIKSVFLRPSAFRGLISLALAHCMKVPCNITALNWVVIVLLYFLLSFVALLKLYSLINAHCSGAIVVASSL